MIGEYLLLVLLTSVTAAGLPGPGDSALLAAGALAASGELHLSLVAVAALVGCAIGRPIGYWLGHSGGRPALERPGRLHAFRLGMLDRGDRLFQRFPRTAPVLVPAPIAGVYRVAPAIFAAASVIAAISWTATTLLAGYAVESVVEGVVGTAGLAGVLVVLVAGGLVYRFGRQRRRRAASTASPRS
jgi:membrane protein DedA with SNARE-associated domain